MKQIIPFKKELLFKTKVSEITSISLEHTLSLTSDDSVSGNFYISGDYKMTDASINREKFYFTCPFEITLDAKYKTSSIVIDIDNFYYEVINNESLQVNIDVYIEGEKIEEEQELTTENSKNSLVIEEETPSETLIKEEIPEIKEVELKITPEEERIDTEEKPEIDKGEQNQQTTIIPEITPNIKEERKDNIKEVEYSKAPKVELEDESENITNQNINNNQNKEFNVFNDIDSSDTYVTYYVYIVKEEDNIDKIIEKFNVTKEELENYNDLSSIKPKDKLIIPAHNE